MLQVEELQVGCIFTGLPKSELNVQVFFFALQTASLRLALYLSQFLLIHHSYQGGKGVGFLKEAKEAC